MSACVSSNYSALVSVFPPHSCVSFCESAFCTALKQPIKPNSIVGRGSGCIRCLNLARLVGTKCVLVGVKPCAKWLLLVPVQYSTVRYSTLVRGTRHRIQHWSVSARLMAGCALLCITLVVPVLQDRRTAHHSVPKAYSYVVMYFFLIFLPDSYLQVHFPLIVRLSCGLELQMELWRKNGKICVLVSDLKIASEAVQRR